MIGEPAVLILPDGLDCPRCGSWKAVQDAEVETVARDPSTLSVHMPKRSGFNALLDNARFARPSQDSRHWWAKLDADRITRPLWRCTTCGCVYDRELQAAIAQHVDDALEFA